MLHSGLLHDSAHDEMSVSVLIATYGDSEWEDLAWSRAWPSANANHPSELLCFHDPDGTIASVRNEVGNQAKSDWLCFLDADDELAPGYLDAMRRAAGQARDGLCLFTPAAVRSGRRSAPSRPAPLRSGSVGCTWPCGRSGRVSRS